MRKIFEEDIQKQEKHLLSIISGNFELSMNEISGNLKKKISDLGESLEYTENVLEIKLKMLKKDIEAWGKEYKKYMTIKYILIT